MCPFGGENGNECRMHTSFHFPKDVVLHSLYGITVLVPPKFSPSFGVLSPCIGLQFVFIWIAKA